MNVSAKTLAGIVLGAAAGAAATYLLATDKEDRKKHIEKIKHQADMLKDKLGKKIHDPADHIAAN